ncbi:hypothetical protein, partial [Ruegeria sp. A3M17]|uniref:hypothetical protein n=1 Tax=Ruegeria sp. A3M17 TaxID=2267229 RepID=UPI000E06B914
MRVKQKSSVSLLVVSPFVGALMVTTAHAAPEVCNGRTARIAANAGDYQTLCDCKQVTPSFLERLQRRSDFESTLAVTGQQCPGLAALLTDFSTASIGAVVARGGEDSDNDQVNGASSTPGGETGSGDNGGGG